ncbi:MAG: VOC family protein [Burkholderiales bacterium]|nr:VOC family protein [Burkholderiales bacterium]
MIAGKHETALPAASPPFDRCTEDIGNIVEFGHVNLRVPDQQIAILFYVTGLGLTRDPYLVTGVDNAWINVGTCQFHLPVGPAQVLNGRVGLVMPDLDALALRLERVAPRLAGTRFAVARADTAIDLTCPWGNRLRVHAPDAARFGRIVLGMPYVEIDVAPGSAAGIARFYREVLAAPVTTATDADGPFARVATGLNGSLVYRETERELPAYDGHHVQITVADFSGVHRRLMERGLISEESDQSQYRFVDIVDPRDGARLCMLEHEVRSMRHPMYARRLVNRDPAITNRSFSAGHETGLWQMPPEG